MDSGKRYVEKAGLRGDGRILEMVITEASPWERKPSIVIWSFALGGIADVNIDKFRNTKILNEAQEQHLNF